MLVSLPEAKAEREADSVPEAEGEREGEAVAEPLAEWRAVAEAEPLRGREGSRDGVRAGEAEPRPAAEALGEPLLRAEAETEAEAEPLRLSEGVREARAVAQWLPNALKVPLEARVRVGAAPLALGGASLGEGVALPPPPDVAEGEAVACHGEGEAELVLEALSEGGAEALWLLVSLALPDARALPLPPA